MHTNRARDVAVPLHTGQVVMSVWFELHYDRVTALIQNFLLIQPPPSTRMQLLGLCELARTSLAPQAISH